MRIIEIEDFFHPDVGYQINILSKYLSRFGHEVHIITAKIDKVPSKLKNFFGGENIDEKDALYSDETGVMIHRVEVLGFISRRAIFKNEIVNMVNRMVLIKKWLLKEE